MKKTPKKRRGGTMEGRRIHLRLLTREDTDLLFAAVESSREVLKRRLRWVAGVRDAADERRFIDASGQDGDASVWGIFDNRSDRLVGVAALDSSEADETGRARLGLWIRAERQDKGYGAEAGRVILDHAFRRAGMHRVFARLDPTNRPFRKVLKKLGLRYEGCLRSDRRLNGRWVDQECWGMLKGEWKP